MMVIQMKYSSTSSMVTFLNIISSSFLLNNFNVPTDFSIDWTMIVNILHYKKLNITLMARCLPTMMGGIQLQEWNPIPTTSHGTKMQKESCQNLTHQLFKRLMI